MISWSHFPQHKGRMSGIIISGFGFGTTVFNLVATALINPDNKKATDKHDGQKYFSRSIADNLPGTLRILALCYLIISVIGILLLGKIKREQTDSETMISTEDECPDVKTGIKTNKFWVLFALGTLSNMPGLYVAAAYKTFGSSNINDDIFLAITGSIASLFNGSFRYIWPQIMDKSTFKSTLSVLLCILCSLMMSFYFISTIKSLFLIWVCGIYACEGGLATLFPSVIAKCFGKM